MLYDPNKIMEKVLAELRAQLEQEEAERRKASSK